ncbi:MAG: hypothetical protein M1825_004592 [Sarcosagium campestre]|nr:MAG: hypothetical protein M1825_004592 [Sarcosagium campestre]
MSTDTIGGRAEDILSTGGTDISKDSTLPWPDHREGLGEERTHVRSTSLGALVGGLGKRQQSPRPRSQDRAASGANSTFTRDASPSFTASEQDLFRETLPEKPLPLPPPPDELRATASRALTKAPTLPITPLKPHILSPNPNEYLLATGTSYAEPGVGIFVNLDGDVSRGTIEFQRYPQSLVIDGEGVEPGSRGLMSDDRAKGFVLAVMDLQGPLGISQGLEIQRWDVAVGERGYEKSWLELLPPESSGDRTQEAPSKSLIGIRHVSKSGDVYLKDISDKLRLANLRINGRSNDQPSSSPSTSSVHSSDSRTKVSVERVKEEIELFESRACSDSESRQEAGSVSGLSRSAEASRTKEEEIFARQFSKQTSSLVAWCSREIWWVVKNPIIMRLDSTLQMAARSLHADGGTLDRQCVVNVLESLRGQEPATELQFLSLGYIRQKASLLLLTDLMDADRRGSAFTVDDRKAIEDSLSQGGLDPRLILAMVPTLRDEVVEAAAGVWVHAGVREVAEKCLEMQESRGRPRSDFESSSSGFLGFVQRYLLAWRRKKGFGSVADEKEVSKSVDAALLRVLLELDRRKPPGHGEVSSFRTELYALVDHGVDCFERAVNLLESYQRLYVLSRLYQSRKLSRKVLATWRRILEGEKDSGGEFVNGEVEIRKYLSRLRDATLVEDYGSWLTARNPKLGVRIFADDESRVRFEPAEVVQILKQKAPLAVKEYLEFLVFSKHNTQYVDDLIAFYLDTVLSVLEISDKARAILFQSYESYRALSPPRPTYREFITENSIDEEWWHNRLRLLQLLGGSHGAVSEYDVPSLVRRIEPFENELVPEMIILDGKQERHQQAIRLLTHGLGDFDTAINYCLLGGSSIFYPTLSAIPREMLPSREDQTKLFGYLLSELLAMKDASHRVEQTGILLERFGGWFDVADVLGEIPDSWSIEIISGFLISALRRIVQEKSETTVAKALSGAENLKVSATLIDKCEAAGGASEPVAGQEPV